MSVIIAAGAGVGYLAGGTLTAAAIGGGLAAAGGSMLASQKSSDSANKAIDAQKEAAARQDALSKEAFDWYKQEYERTRPQRDAAEAVSNDISQTQLGGMRLAMDQAKDQQNYNISTYRPLEQRIVADAQAYDTQARRDQEAARAVADVQQKSDAQRGIVARELMRTGVNPGSGRYAAMQNQNAIGTAAAEAAAANNARRYVEQTGTARMMDAAGLGRGVVGNQATFLNAANNSGNAAMGNTISGLNAQMSGVPLMTNGFNTAITGANNSARNYSSMADMFNNQAGMAIKGFGNFMQGMGSLGWKPFGN